MLEGTLPRLFISLQSHFGNTNMALGRRICRSGFTLIEALVSTAIATIAGTAMLLGVANAIDTADDVVNEALAQGLAKQLLDEMAGGAYQEPGTAGFGLGPEAGELQGLSRWQFDDLDDYHGLKLQPPRDAFGQEIGRGDGAGGLRHPNFQLPAGRFARWRQEVAVEYVGEANLDSPLPSGQTSNYRRASVRVFLDLPRGGTRQLAVGVRVFAKVPQL